MIKMFVYATPEECGISSSVIEKFIRRLDENGYAMHSVMMARGEKIFAEGHWKPFDAGFHHRLNSVTKSFVAIAVGLLADEGKLLLSDKICRFFEEINFDNTDENIRNLTIEDMLSMRTVSGSPKGHWVRDQKNDRIGDFFGAASVKYADTLFRYDSDASYILCVLVERLSGMSLTDYLKQKLLCKMDFSPHTDCIKCPDGYSWGDSGLLCRTKDLLKFAKFVMDKGVYNGNRLISEEFITRAVSKISDTNQNGFEAHNTFGYGYQIWKTYEDGFAFFGMGDQLVICIPKKEFIFVCTADNQGNPGSRPVIMNLLYHDIIKELSDAPLNEDKIAHESLNRYLDSLELVSLKGEKSSPSLKYINNAEYTLQDNPMCIKSFTVSIDENGNKGVFKYENKQGKKELDFAMCKNVYSIFPQDGYPDMQMNVECKGNKYPCAVSAAWLEERKLGIRVQMTGNHLGGLYICIGFSSDYGKVSVYMTKNTNCFLNEYSGYAVGIRKQER